jgi:hypothetical protein
MNQRPHVAVVGATGAVGIEMLKTLEKRNFPVGKLTLLASTRSVGKKLTFRGKQCTVAELAKDSFTGVDIALFSAGGTISREYAPIAVQAGCDGAGDQTDKAVGEPATPTLVVYRTPEDTSQDYHIEGLPFGTRGGMLRNHVFPSDGEYTITVTPISRESRVCFFKQCHCSGYIHWLLYQEFRIPLASRSAEEITPINMDGAREARNRIYDRMDDVALQR